MIAEAAIFEGLRLGRTVYYTTPLIALTDQKFQELQESAERWGFSRDDVGLVTGNRKVNPQARILVVVAEILLNRLLHHEAFDFREVWAVVMDEFHSFNDPERGIVWEFGLGLLPPNVRTMLLSATIGNAREFCGWLNHKHNRDLKLIEGTERKVPLSFSWIEDEILPDHIESMHRGDETARTTPALIFCFNREQCWTTAEMLKGKKVVSSEQQREIGAILEQHDWSEGAGPKLKQILLRGIGVHHAGVLPRYRRIVEMLFQRKLLSFCVCTETLAAGINLPARSVVMPSLLKGPPGKMKLIDPSGAHQMFGRAGRPQFDDRGYVFALAHEDDVKLKKWQEKFDSIPADSKDPGLLKAKKQLKKKQPKRRDGVQYWNEQQFEQLVAAKPGDLASRGELPWRMLVYLLDVSPDIQLIRDLVGKRLLDARGAERAQQQLTRMLITLWRAGYIELEPRPPAESNQTAGEPDGANDVPEKTAADSQESAGGNAPQPTPVLDLGQRKPATPPPSTAASHNKKVSSAQETERPAYVPRLATPTDKLPDLLRLRGVHPLYGLFLMSHLGVADRAERLQALESLLELPRSMGRSVWVPPHEELPPGPLALGRLDSQLLKLGLATAEEISGALENEEDRGWTEEPPVRTLTLAHKLHRLFEYDFPGVPVKISPVWVAGELLEFGCDFNKYITSKKMQKQEGLVFRHLLRLVLVIDEVAELCPPETTRQEWQDDLGDIANQLEQCCRRVDSYSTDQWLDDAKSNRGEEEIVDANNS